MISLKGKEEYIYPTYASCRFFEGKIVKCSWENVIFALCDDNSSEGPALLLRYDTDKY